MNNVVVRVEDLGKRYRIGEIAGYKTLRESLTNAVAAPFRRIRGGGSSPPRGHERNHIWALRNISFEIKRGEVLAVIGGNGAGKSTLLKILSRITPPTEGHAEIRGRVGSLLEVGTGFHPELTGRENVYLNGAILGMGRGEVARKFDEIAHFSGVEKFLDTPVKHYSSGMYVRLAFSVAAHLEPDILIVDEVLAVGDAAFQKKCLGKMSEVAGGGRTVLFVSHNMSAVRALCPRTLLLNEGSLQSDSTTAEVMKLYLGGGNAMSSQVVWPVDRRPGNGGMKLNSAGLTNYDGSPTSSFDISKGALVKIDFEVIEEGTKAVFALTPFDSEGNRVFTSISNIEERYQGKRLHTGRYVSTCKLPGDLLNAGDFTIQIAGFGAQWGDGFVLDHVISFSAVDAGTLRADYHGRYLGPLRPRLEWKTRRADE